MNKEERFEIELNQEDVQNIINCYEKDIKLIEQLQQENKEQEEYITYWQKETDKRQDKIDKAIEYIEKFSDPSIGAIKKILKDSDVDECE